MDMSALCCVIHTSVPIYGGCGEAYTVQGNATCRAWFGASLSELVPIRTERECELFVSVN